MENKNILDALAKVRKDTKERKFKQTVDLVINIKDIDLKKPEEKLDLFLQLPKDRIKKAKICALVDDERLADAKKACDTVIHKDDFAKYEKDKAALKRITNDHAFFVTQPQLMPEVAKAFGRILGPRGKMPNPKAGCIIPPKVPMEAIVDRLRKTVRLQTKNDKAVRVAVGDEGMPDADIAVNVLAVYNVVVAKLPQHEANIVSVLLKLTMSPPAEVQK